VSPGARFPVPAKAALGLALAAGLWCYLAFAGERVKHAKAQDAPRVTRRGDAGPA
jgi:hypothetical protein